MRPSDAIKVSENLVNISSGKDSAPNRSQAIALRWRHVVSEIQGSFYVGAQPMRDECYIETSSLIGWMHTQNDPWIDASGNELAPNTGQVIA